MYNEKSQYVTSWPSCNQSDYKAIEAICFFFRKIIDLLKLFKLLKLFVLFIGDKLFVSQYYDKDERKGNTTEYIGYVHLVLESEVALGFDQKWVNFRCIFLHCLRKKTQTNTGLCFWDGRWWPLVKGMILKIWITLYILFTFYGLYY